MEITKELAEELKEKYNVYYNNYLKAYMRTEGKWNRKDFELGKVTELITGENILTHGKSYVEYEDYKEPGHICVCGCPFCTKLHRLYHVSTGICFLVGSICITKAGHENFIKDLNCAKTNGTCVKCKCPLIIKGERKNSDKQIIDIMKICYGCRGYERHYLNIKYHERDDYKKKYGTKWDADNKLWYWKGYRDKMPNILVGRLIQLCLEEKDKVLNIQELDCLLKRMKIT